MNITDIDDKIIYRARRNFLFDKYVSSAAKRSRAEVLADAENAAAASSAKLSATEARLLGLKAKATNAKQHQEIDSEIESVRLKMQHVTKAIEAARASEAADGVLKSARDQLAEWLDDSQRETATDTEIYRKHTAKYEQEFHEDMAALGVLPPDVLTRVTEYVPQIVAFIEKVIANGFAYESAGSVYFDTVAFKKSHTYAKNAPSSAGSDAALPDESDQSEEKEKRNPRDFALWKKSKRGEPTWPSPWGAGRPGWHIECSAMATDLLGERMDVHSGGIDLRFPHHDNELAQSEAFHNCHQWVNYFLHAGHLHIEGLKMSKSLKNFITIRQILQVYPAKVLRMLFLLHPWDATLNFSDSSMVEANSFYKVFREFFLNTTAAMRRRGTDGPQSWSADDREVYQHLSHTQLTVHAALCDNVNTEGAIRALAALVNRMNVYMTTATFKTFLVNSAVSFIRRILKVFGIEEGEQASGASELAPVMDLLASFRDTVRSEAKRLGGVAGPILERCDWLRDEALPAVGIRLEDGSAGSASIWKQDDPAVLARERREKLAMAKEKELAKALKAKPVDEARVAQIRSELQALRPQID
eukprot:TRINITY_DN2832_c0_g1_i2.p1 TRINITY_DN2832_c0_g1~~TRINITY_DN2832_c0_g1_i2.p1  ORF type:complete len:587 (-),score=118.91 TRINITY_DN2832_c0_g1_i2:778-2538(-)